MAVTRWQTYEVLLKGEDEPLLIRPDGRDYSRVVVDPAQVSPMDMLFHVLHNALLRLGHPVPRDYEGFMEVLDGMPEAQDPAGESLDPTGAAPSDG